jgi:hypothetical protein
LKSMPIGALHPLGLAVPGDPGTALPGEDYEAKGAVQTTQDNSDCGLEEDPRGTPASGQFGNGLMDL